jgi:ligand-binding SRPBCC domain-containing protein
MGSLVVETFIAAPQEVVFDLARDVLAHMRSAAFTGERAVPPGRLDGLLDLGDIVTFESRHFGVRQRYTVKIVELDRPRRFVDELVKSALRSMRHVHEFEPRDGGTLMRDALEWVAPLGVIADRLFVERHLRHFVTTKQLALKAIAEST